MVRVERRRDRHGSLAEIFGFLAASLLGFEQPPIFNGCGCVGGKHLQQRLLLEAIREWRVTLRGDHPDDPVADPHGDSHQRPDMF
jgi:hypothetical protein